MGRIYRVRIHRCDPAGPDQSFYRTYEVEAPEKVTVLELLEEIYRKHDGEISFRRSCGTGKCGACVVEVNGRRALACQKPAGERELTVEPVGDCSVIRDLTTAVEQTPADPGP
jgi:succinate dehydrogenase/fumarate reductase iron-sulfur protein